MTPSGEPAPGLVSARVPAPWGPIHTAASDRGVVAVELMTPDGLFESTLAERHRAPVSALPDVHPRDPRRRLLERLDEAIRAYLDGRSPMPDDLPLDLAARSDWDVAVLRGVRGVPFGTVVSYGGVARLIGRAGAARAVGGAVGRNPLALLVPCHRVIAGDGGIGGYGGEWWGSREERLGVKRSLLELEGIELPVRLDPATGLFRPPAVSPV